MLEVQGIFAGKWLKLTFDIDDDTIDNNKNNFEDNLKILKEQPDEIKITSGTRLDILMRTHPKVLYELSDYRLENDNLTLYERLIEVFKNLDGYPNIDNYVKSVSSLHGIDDAMMILKQKE